MEAAPVENSIWQVPIDVLVVGDEARSSSHDVIETSANNPIQQGIS
jgi:hypothetical protein